MSSTPRPPQQHVEYRVDRDRDRIAGKIVQVPERIGEKVVERPGPERIVEMPVEKIVQGKNISTLLISCSMFAYNFPVVTLFTIDKLPDSVGVARCQLRTLVGLVHVRVILVLANIKIILANIYYLIQGASCFPSPLFSIGLLQNIS